MLENKKIIYTVLAISLAINFILIGAAGSAAWRWNQIRGDGAWLEKRLDRAEERMLDRLEGDDRALAQDVCRQRRPELTGAVKEIRAARKDFRSAIMAETPNPAELTAALDRSQAAAQKINETVHGTVRDMAQGLSVEARREIATHMQRRVRRAVDRP